MQQLFHSIINLRIYLRKKLSVGAEKAASHGLALRLWAADPMRSEVTTGWSIRRAAR
jgi:hypothetical protein